MQASKIYTFGPYRLDIADARLWRDDEVIPLQPKTFAMLAYLVTHRGVLVSKDELLDAVWDGRYVVESVLKSTAQLIRRALDDNPKEPAYLETVHRLGYRFIAEVSCAEKVEPPEAAREPDDNEALLVGRDDALAQLRQSLALALAGQAQLVFINGEAGIGKTTLIDAFVAELPPELAVASGQCVDQYGESEAYLPLLEALNSLCRSRGEAVLQRLRHIAPDWLEQLPWLDPGNTTRPLSQEISPTQTRMLRELGELLAQCTQDFPLLLVLEDLHWSDWATVDALAFLAKRRNPARWLILASYRPADVLLHNHPLEKLRQDLRLKGLCREIPLAPLSQQTVAEYLGKRFPDAKFSLQQCAAVYSRTEGLPFFLVRLAEEMAQSVESDDLFAEQYLHALPQGVQQLIEQRFERLPQERQQLLNAASAAGTAFSVRLLADILQQPLLETEQHCEGLARQRDFLCRANKLGQGEHEGEYAFLHAYDHEFVYTRLPPISKAEWHRRIATWLENNGRIGIDETLSEVATHFEKAGIFDKALQYLQRALENAQRRQAPHEAAALARRAIALLEQHAPDTPENGRRKIALYIALGVALRVGKGYGADEQQYVYTRALELARQLNDTVLLPPLLMAIGSFHLVRLDLQAAADYSRQVVELAERHGWPHYRLSAELLASGAALLQGAIASSLIHMERVKALYHPGLDKILLAYSAQHPLASSGFFTALAYWLNGYPQRAIAVLETALPRTDSLGHAGSSVFARWAMAVCLCLCGEYARMGNYCAEIENQAEEYNLLALAGMGRIENGRRRFETGEIDAGLEEMRRGLQECTAAGTRSVRTYQLASYAECCLRAGHPDTAEQTLQEAQELLETQGERFFEAELHRLRGELYLQDANTHANARACFDQALQVARRQGAKSLALRAAMSLARMPGGNNTALKAIFASFDEGFETQDLRAASALLEASGAMIKYDRNVTLLQ